MKKIIFWFRRDLRLNDNAGLFHALKNNENVLPIFIFDISIVEKLPKNDARVTFIHNELIRLKSELNAIGSDIEIYHGKPFAIWKQITSIHDIQSVYTNHDYEPYGIQRDLEIKDFLASQNIEFKTYKDQVIFEKSEVTKDDGKPYTVFTPYSKKWKARLTPADLAAFTTEPYFDSFLKTNHHSKTPTLSDIGFEKSKIPFPKKTVSQGIIKTYDRTRDIPKLEDGTSHLGLHFRFGTISIREKVKKAQSLNETFLSELIWREFYMMILHHFPHVIGNAFKPKYDVIEWEKNTDHFKAWCEGKTGYPMVDAGMRQLNKTGYMHNRVRMVTASFLCKHLLLDWRLGEQYFAEKLLDFELASNNGGWQWASGTGCDAAPYFRVFNPTLQMEKFDPQKEYIQKWVPDFGTDSYPEPIVEHKFARERAIERYKQGLQ